MDTADLSLWRFLFPPIHREGIRFVLIAGIVALAAHSLFIWLGHPLVALLFWILPACVYYFFRDPERIPPLDADAIVSPADGTVCLIVQVPMPEQLGLELSPIVWRISVFMSVLNVHVNRMPAEGTITKTHYIPGEIVNASLDKASESNERLLYLMTTTDGQQLAFVQIAGLVARRIVGFAKEGQKLARAERFGLIRFGSRVDVYLPQGIEPSVRVGQTMVAGETIIARLTKPGGPGA
ncbi:MAG: phosphatidylserine decarboxylase [Kiritimatiellaeota bacterium]|nr:phosphatidylserine decarboxylase [Kiritimatiellota bacterium]